MTTEQVIQGFKRELFGFVRRYIKDDDAAKDVHQEILIKIFTHQHSLKNQDSLKSWIYQIARNSINDYFRRKKVYFSQLDNDTADITTTQISEDELLDCIKPFLNQLRPSYKQALELTDLGNNTQKELAEKMNISYSGAKSTVQRARHQLRELFNQCCKIEADKYGSILSVTQNTNCSCP
jgi:RNA polymerase sigma-70 factor (ECF subfamily)